MKRKTTERYYNIHDILRLKLIDKTGFLSKFLRKTDLAYKNFLSDPTDQIDITIELSNFDPLNQDCYILDGRYFVKENYLYCSEDSYKIAKWRFEICGFETNSIVARIHSNLIGNMFIQGNIMSSLICFQLNEKGCPMIHASCVSRNNSAYLFSARGGGGKTMTALYFIERGFDLLGDNFIILQKNDVLSFLSPLAIFTYNIVPIDAMLGFKEKTILTVKDLLYRVTRGYVKIFTVLNPVDLFPNSVVHCAQLKSIFLLIPKERFCVEPITKNEMINYLVKNQQIDSFPFYNYALEYSYMFPESKLATLWDRYRENLKANLSEDLHFYKVEVPREYDAKLFENIFDLLLSTSQVSKSFEEK